MKTRTWHLVASALIPACATTGAEGTAPDAGSSSTASSTASTPCNPLDAPPTALENVLGVGQASDGTLYVADLPSGATIPRVFVSTGSALVRQHVAGSGENGSNQYLLSFEPAGAPESSLQNLLLDVNDGRATAMALGPSDSKSFLGGPGQTLLTLVDASTVASRSVQGLPALVDFVGDGEKGDEVVVTTPMDDGGFSLFYGTNAGSMSQRTVVSTEQALSGYPTFVFVVGASRATLDIPAIPDPDAGPIAAVPGTGALSLGGATETVTFRWPTPSTLAGFAFTCF